MSWQEHNPDATLFYVFTPWTMKLQPVKAWAIEVFNAQYKTNFHGPCLVVNEFGVVYANQKTKIDDKDRWLKIGEIDLSKLLSDEQIDRSRKKVI